MKRPMILGLLAITLFSCKKEQEVLKPIKGVYKEQSVFPMWEGDIWRCDHITYNYMDSSRYYQTYYDTLKAPQKRYDGKEYYRFFYEFYTLLDNNTLQTSFDNTDWWRNAYMGEYIWFADVNKIDTLSTIQFYSDVSPDKAMTIAYPERVKMNGYDCKRTEIVYFSSYNGTDRFEGKRVVYFAKGYGPVYEVQYWRRLKDFNIPNGPWVEYKAYEKTFTRVSVNNH